MGKFCIPFTLNQYGFSWGALTVTRLFHDDTDGMVCVGLKSKTYDLELYVLRGGKMRLFRHLKNGQVLEIDLTRDKEGR